MKFSMFIQPPRPTPASVTGWPESSTRRSPRTLIHFMMMFSL